MHQLALNSNESGIFPVDSRKGRYTLVTVANGAHRHPHTCLSPSLRRHAQITLIRTSHILSPQSSRNTGGKTSHLGSRTQRRTTSWQPGMSIPIGLYLLNPLCSTGTERKNSALWTITALMCLSSGVSIASLRAVSNRADFLFGDQVPPTHGWTSFRLLKHALWLPNSITI
jgi:hypothetical protein